MKGECNVGNATNRKTVGLCGWQRYEEATTQWCSGFFFSLIGRVIALHFYFFLHQLWKVNGEYTVGYARANLCLVDIVGQYQRLLKLSVGEFATQVVHILVLIFLLVLVLHLDDKVASAVDVHIEVFLRHARGSHFHGVLSVVFHHIDRWGGGIGLGQ